MCIRDKNKDAGMKSKEIERARREGGGRQHYRHVDGVVPLCMRKKVDENEAKSKENEKSSSSRENVMVEARRRQNMLKLKAKAQETAAAAAKQT